MATWIERQQTDLKITTGDKTTYTPDYVITRVNKDKEFNVSKFEFVGVSGSLVKRNLPMGRTYEMEIIFQGADHLTVANNFDKSSNDSRYWKIEHPMYGALTVQPSRIEFDNADANISRITCQITETNEGKAFLINDPTKAVSDYTTNTNTALMQRYMLDIPTPSVSGIQQMQNNVNNWFNKINKLIASSIDLSTYLNYYNSVNALLNNAVFDNLVLIQTVTNMVYAPVYFVDTLKNRLSMLQFQIAETNAAMLKLLGNPYIPFTRENKVIFQTNAGLLISAMCYATITNTTDEDYPTREDVLNTMSGLLSYYNEYINNLDLIQSNNAGVFGSFTPDGLALMEMDNLIMATLNHLFTVADKAKIKKTKYLENQTNIIILAQKLYGLNTSDSTIDLLISSNNLNRFELLQLPKGKQISYFV